MAARLDGAAWSSPIDPERPPHSPPRVEFLSLSVALDDRTRRGDGRVVQVPRYVVSADVGTPRPGTPAEGSL